MSSSEAIKKELDIFQCCEIKIREFAEDLITDAVRDKAKAHPTWQMQRNVTKC